MKVCEARRGVLVWRETEWRNRRQPANWAGVRDIGAGSFIFSVMIFVAILILNPTPRNPDNSRKAEILTPAFAAIAALVTWILLRGPRYWPLRFACWWMAVLSYAFAIGGALVLIIKASA